MDQYQKAMMSFRFFCKSIDEDIEKLDQKSIDSLIQRAYNTGSIDIYEFNFLRKGDSVND
jgi:hypothetical protein